MSVFSRFMDIVNSNINALLDKAEDPEKMIRLMIGEMEDTLIELKTSCSEKIASKTGQKRKIAEAEAQIERWQKRATLAIQKGRDDLAREALIEKRKCLEKIEDLKKDSKVFDDAINQMKEEITQLEEKLDSVREKYQSIVKKRRVMQEQETIYKNDSSSDSTMYDKLDEELEKLKKQNAKDDLEAKFRDLEEEDSISEELKNLKDKK